MTVRLGRFLPKGVELRYSRTGVPRIKSRSTVDAFRALGVLHGWDRGMQIALSGFAAAGLLCKHFGFRPHLLAMDRRSRALGISRREENLEATGGRLTGDLTAGDLTVAYLDGLDSVRASGRRSALFRLLGIRYPSWSVHEMSALIRYLSYSLAHTQGDQEIGILKAITAGPDYVTAWSTLLPDAFRQFDASSLEGLMINDQPYTILRGTSAAAIPGPRPSPGPPVASNNWVVNGARSASGGVIFCNDPHLAVNRLPGFWYQAELITPDLYLMGFSVPGTPSFVGGWNGQLSWGITHAATDTEDLVIEQCREGRIERAGGWREPQFREESIPVKSASDDLIGIYELDGGILHGNPESAGRYLRRKWPGLQASASETLNGLMKLPFCRDVAEGLDAARRAEAIDLNWILGDRDGHIGYQMSGSPIKHGRELEGILPQLGWSPGFREPEVGPPTDLPRVMDPKDGLLVTANQRIQIDGYPVHQSLPLSPDRADRIRDLISGSSDIDRSHMQRIQYDVLSLQARRVMAFCQPYLPDEARDFQRWDCRFDTDSCSATLYDAFGRKLLRAVLGDRLVPSDVLEAILTGSFLELVSHKLFEDAYADPNGPFRDVNWKALVPEVYSEAVREVTAGLRGQPKRWGRANRIVLRHPILGRTAIGRFVNSGPFEYPGYGSTPFQGRTLNHGRANEHTTGPTYHLIVDFGEGAAYTNAPSGRTERPLHQHYRLGIASWLTGRYERFSPPSVENLHGRRIGGAEPEA